MTNYIITIRVPADYQPSEDSEEPWRAWFGTLGDKLVDHGNPVFSRSTLGSAGSGANLGGYTFIKAESLEEAVEAARSCPILSVGGGVEVGEITEIM